MSQVTHKSPQKLHNWRHSDSAALNHSCTERFHVQPINKPRPQPVAFCDVDGASHLFGRQIRQAAQQGLDTQPAEKTVYVATTRFAGLLDACHHHGAACGVVARRAVARFGNLACLRCEQSGGHAFGDRHLSGGSRTNGVYQLIHGTTRSLPTAEAAHV